MGILNITDVQREGARLVIGLAGVSGGGKTRTAIELAWGLAKGDASKIGFLDTENRRGRLYDNCLVGKDGTVHKFKHADLYAPFSPSRYSQAIKEFQEFGTEVLIIDSGSHEWEGEGGCEDIADDGGKVANWKKSKREHKRFMNTLLTCDMHVIVCLRAREKTSFKNPSKPESLGIQPICEKSFLFEMTASLMIGEQGRMRDVIKCPEELMPFLGHREEYLGAKDGMRIRQWVDGAIQLDPEIERARNTILSHTAEGLAKVEDLWSALAAKTKKSLGQQFIDMARSSAQEFDAQAAARNQSQEDDLDMSSGGFNPMTAADPDMVAAHKPDDAPPQYEDDPFAESA